MSFPTTMTNKAASGSVKATPGYVWGVQWVAGASAGTIILKDGGSSGTALIQIDTPASATAHGVLMLPTPIKFSTNIYATITNAAQANTIHD